MWTWVVAIFRGAAEAINTWLARKRIAALEAKKAAIQKTADEKKAARAKRAVERSKQNNAESAQDFIKGPPE